MSGHFTWFDLMTTDTAEDERFYGDALGYGTQKWDGPMPYTIWSAGGVPFGGLMDLPEKARAMGAPSHWLGYVAVPDVDAAAAKATSLGATVLVPPTTITPTAKFTVLADPQGAVIAMYSSTDGGAKPVANVCWHELMTEDMDGAIAFYGAMFGWTKGPSMDLGPAGTYQLLHIGDTPMVGVMRRPPEMPMPAWGVLPWGAKRRYGRRGWQGGRREAAAWPHRSPGWGVRRHVVGPDRRGLRGRRKVLAAVGPPVAGS